MDAEKKQVKKKRSLVKTILTIVVAVIVLIVLVVLFAIPAYISSEGGREKIVAKINESVDGRADIGSLSMGWFKGVKLTDFSFADDAGQTSVRIEKIQTKPHYAALIGGNLSFGRTVIEKPRVELRITEELRQKKKQKDKDKDKEPDQFELPVSKIDLEVIDGDVRITDTKSQSVHLKQINSHLNLKGINRKNDFDLEMLVADDSTTSKLRAEGNIKPAKSSGELTIEINELDIASLAPIFDLADINVDGKGIVSANVETKFANGKILNLTGNVRGRDVDFGGDALGGDRIKSDSLLVDVQVKQSGDIIDVGKLLVQSDWAKVDMSGTVPMTMKSFGEFLSPEAEYAMDCEFDFDIAAAGAAMPATFKLKPDTQITSGKLSGKVSRTGQAGQRKISANAELAGLAGLVSGRSVALSEPIRAQALITAVKDTISVEKLQATASFASINAYGTDKLLTYEAQADLGQIQRELGQFVDFGKYSIGGKVVENGKITTDKKRINLTAKATITNLLVRSQDGSSVSEPQTTMDVDMNMDRKTKDVAIKSFITSGSFGSVKVKDAVLPTSKAEARNLSLPVDAQLDLEKIRPFALLLPAYPKDMYLTGQAKSLLKVSRQDGAWRIFTDQTQIANFSLATPKTEPFQQDLVDLDLDARISADEMKADFELNSPQIKIKGNYHEQAKKDTTNMQAKLGCDYDWAAVSNLISTFMPGLNIEGKGRKTELDLTSTFPTKQPAKRWANANLAKPLNIGFEKAEYKGLIFQPTSINLSIAGGVMDLKPFTATVNNGQLSFASSTDFGAEPAFIQTPGPMQIASNIELNRDITVKLFRFLNPLFGEVSELEAKGTFDFHCDELAIPISSSAKQLLRLDGKIGMKDVQVSGRGFMGQLLKLAGKSGEPVHLMTVHPTQITVRNGLLGYKDMQVDIPEAGMTLRFTSTVDLEKEVYLEGSKVVVEGLGTVHFAGPVKKPVPDLVKSGIDTLLQEGLKEGLPEGLGEKLPEGLGDLLKGL